MAKGLSKRAGEILDQITAPAGANDATELALLYKRAGDMQKAHNVFASNYDVLMNDPTAVHEYAQTKMKLAARIRGDAVTKRRINEEAAELLRRAIQLADNPTRQAWCWMEPGQRAHLAACAGFGHPPCV
ncbi:MAG: hypothetical protein K6T81_19765 [Alicyclobacillus macrosporangiidus]|uniref:hypothetical protein n=1 Tax=Alicyclobacillus macrosporangiidus TaxID=392015 RepID=UPI0026EC024C|nr:hypothetical protein [Alicyclobacillus macrosporangiidus]MCL6600949.1 hypothetical protein [Alicyclobacillus macrosporangiidus]